MVRRIVGAWLVAGAVAGAACAAGDEGGLAPLPTNQPMTMDALLGQVEGSPLFVQDILRPLDAELKRLAGLPNTTLTDFRAGARDAISKQISIAISDALMLKAARDGIQEDDERRVEAYMHKAAKDLLTTYGGSKAVADKELLAAEGKTYDQKLADMRRKATRDMYLHRMLYPKITVTRSDVLRAYERDLKAKYTLQSEIDLYTITLPVARWLPKEMVGGKPQPIRNPSAEQVAEATRLAVEQAKELLAKIRQDPSDKNFADLAESYSADVKKKDGGRWARTKLGTLASEALEKVAFSLPPHSVAEPLVIEEKDPLQSRVVIIRVGETKPGRVVPFSEAQADIEIRLRAEQEYKLRAEYMRKLQEKAAIEAVDHMVEVAVDAAQSRYAVR